MKPVEYDVYLCCRDVEEHGMASEAATGLARLGFRVFVSRREPGATADAGRRRAIEEAPDFVLLSAPVPPGPGGTGADPRAADLAHAIACRRNIVVLSDSADGDPLTAEDPPGFPRLAPWQRVVFDRARPRESIALVAYRLESATEVDDRRLMRMAKRAAIAAAVVLLAAIALRAVPAAVKYRNRPKAPPPLPRFTLYWAAFGERRQNDQWIGFPVTDGAEVSGGDRLRIVFSTGSDGYAYVVLRDVQGGISLIHPGVTLRGASRVRAGTVYQAPGEDSWFTVDPQSGLATVYVFAGHEPLENLEELLEEPERGASHASRVELLTSTLAGLLDGKHTAVPRPIRTRGGREIVDSLSSAPAPSMWSATLTGGAVVTQRPSVQTGLLSAVGEIRLGPGPQK